MDAQTRTTREAYTLFWHKNDNVKIPSAGSSSIIVMLFLHAYQIFPSFSTNSCGFSAASLILYTLKKLEVVWPSRDHITPGFLIRALRHSVRNSASSSQITNRNVY